jgi:hypothetical protein
MSKHPELWSYTFTETEQDELTQAVLHFQSLNKTLKEMKKEDFPMPSSVIYKINEWDQQLKHGLGFALARGVPVHKWTLEQSEIFYFAFGHYLGIPGAQDIQGNLLGHVTDVGPTNQTERPYRTREDIVFHVDGSDVVSLLCIHPAKKGGASRIISMTRVYNEVLKHSSKGKEYIKRLYSRVLLFTRKTFGVARFLPVLPCRMDAQGVIRSYYNQEFYVKSYRHPNGSLTEFGEKDPFALETVDYVDSILDDDLRHRNRGDGELGLDMVLQAGDLQMVSNHFILHARTDFEDYSQEEIEAVPIKDGFLHRSIGKRDLLRLWLSHRQPQRSWFDFITKQIDLMYVFEGLAEGLIFYR